MHPNLLGSSLDILQLVLRLHPYILDLADWFIDVWDLSLLCSLHPLCRNLQSSACCASGNPLGSCCGVSLDGSHRSMPAICLLTSKAQ